MLNFFIIIKKYILLQTHCGQGITVHKHQFNSLMGAKDGNVMVREAARLIFGREELKNSSLRWKNGGISEREQNCQGKVIETKWYKIASGKR